MRLANGAWVLVADGEKALTLVNEGDADIINLRRVSVAEEKHPRTSDMAGDRVGRVHQSSDARRSGTEETDLHDRAEQAFLRGVAEGLDAAARGGRFTKLVVIAPPRALAVLRAAWTAPVKDALLAELAKDLTAHPIPDIEAAVTAA
jgi:protein required for attachment to host cells